MPAANDPLRFVSRLFELAVWPLQEASRSQASAPSMHRQKYIVLLLYPAMLLFPLLCLLIAVFAIAYVFLVLPVITLGRWASRWINH